MSVIVPAFNCEKYIGDALTSLMKQSISDIEIIVVDDGSTDATAIVADEFASRDSRIQVIRRDNASGKPACARNDGLRVARGEYIALLDADDIATPDRLTSSIAAMRKTGARFAFADFRKVYQDTGLAEATDVLESANFLDRAAEYLTHKGGNFYLCDRAFPAFLLTYIAVNTPTIVFKRELLDEVDIWFDESIVCFEDVDLWFRLANRTQFVFINETHALNRRHSASLTASNPLPTKVDGIAVRKEHLKRLRSGLSRHEITAARENIADLLWDVSYTNWCNGHLAKARAGFLDSWLTMPSSRSAVGFLKAFVRRDMAVSIVATADIVKKPQVVWRDREASYGPLV
ncbi:MAG: glycosyltransferase [Gemmatimonadaceae bacterium]